MKDGIFGCHPFPILNPLKTGS